MGTGPSVPNSDLLQFNILPSSDGALPRFSPSLSNPIDNRLLYFVTPERFTEELRMLDKFLEDKESDMCPCYWKTLCLQQMELELQAKLNDTSHRTGPLQWKLKPPGMRVPCCGGFNGWMVEIQLPAGSTNKILTGTMPVRAGAAPGQQSMPNMIMVQPYMQPMMMGMNQQPVYAQREGVPGAPMPVLMPPVLPPQSQPVWLDASPPPAYIASEPADGAAAPNASGDEAQIPPDVEKKGSEENARMEERAVPAS